MNDARVGVDRLAPERLAGGDESQFGILCVA
jgi:hypothetical protein